MKDHGAKDDRLRAAFIYDEDDVSVRTPDGSQKTEQRQFAGGYYKGVHINKVTHDDGLVLNDFDTDAEFDGDEGDTYVPIPASIREKVRCMVGVTATFASYFYSDDALLKYRMNAIVLPIPANYVALWPRDAPLQNRARQVVTETIPDRKKNVQNWDGDKDGIIVMMNKLVAEIADKEKCRYKSVFITTSRLRFIEQQKQVLEFILSEYGHTTPLITFHYNSKTTKGDTTETRIQMTWHLPPTSEFTGPFMEQLHQSLNSSKRTFKLKEDLVQQYNGVWCLKIKGTLHFSKDTESNDSIDPSKYSEAISTAKQRFTLGAFYDIVYAIAEVLEVKPFVVMTSGSLCDRGHSCKTSDHRFPLTDELISIKKTRGDLYDDMDSVLQKLRIFSRDEEQQQRTLWVPDNDREQIKACLLQAQQMASILVSYRDRFCFDIVNLMEKQFDHFGLFAASHRLFQTKMPLVTKKLHNAKKDSLIHTYLTHPTAYSQSEDGCHRRNILLCLSIAARHFIPTGDRHVQISAHTLLDWLQEHDMIRNMATLDDVTCHDRCFLYKFERTGDMDDDDALFAQNDAALDAVKLALARIADRLRVGKVWMGISVIAWSGTPDTYEFSYHHDLPTNTESHNAFLILYGALLPNEGANLSIAEIITLVREESPKDDDPAFRLTDDGSTVEQQIEQTLRYIRSYAVGYNMLRNNDGTWQLKVDEKLVPDLRIRFNLEALGLSTQAEAIVRFLISRPGETFRSSNLADLMRDAGRVFVRGAPTTEWQTGAEDSPDTFYISKYSTAKTMNDAGKQVRTTISRAMNVMFNGDSIRSLDRGDMEQFKPDGSDYWHWRFTPKDY